MSKVETIKVVPARYPLRAVGAAVACPDRRVFALLGDGGAMYPRKVQANFHSARRLL